MEERMTVETFLRFKKSGFWLCRLKDEADIALCKEQRQSKDTGGPVIPPYVRVHAEPKFLGHTKEEFTLQLGFKRVFLHPNASLDSFKEAVQQLAPKDFLDDFHFKDIIVLAKGMKVSRMSLLRKGHFFLQDKESCAAVHILAPDPQSTILDCCAAPGMQTIHLSAVMQNKGKIIALDRDAERFATLELNIKFGKVTNCESFCVDFTEVDPTIEPYSSVEYILLDPPCSESGIADSLDACPNSEHSKLSKNDIPIEKLSELQIKLLKHALKFPNVKRIVYLTRSVHEEENELVVNVSLHEFSNDFIVGHALPEWPKRGSEKYSFGQLCIRGCPESTLTNGFFLAVINRITKPNKNQVNEISKCPYQW